MPILIQNVAEVERYIVEVRRAAKTTVDWLINQQIEPLALLRRIKFEAVGQHPIGGHRLNFIEQINQTWTYLAALAAARQLLILHPGAGGFWLAPGAHAARPLDIMSRADGFVGAETFAAVHPDNNQELARDLNKMGGRGETYRYVFFISPRFPGTGRQPQLERDGVQVWSVDID